MGLAELIKQVKALPAREREKVFFGDPRFGGKVSLCPAEANQTRGVARR
jgi:hypothetical protein